MMKIGHFWSISLAFVLIFGARGTLGQDETLKPINSQGDRQYFWPQQQPGFNRPGQFSSYSQIPGQYPGQYPNYRPPYGQYPGPNYNRPLGPNSQFYSGNSPGFYRPPTVLSFQPTPVPVVPVATTTVLPLQPGVVTTFPLGAGTGFQRPTNTLVPGQPQPGNPILTPPQPIPG